MDENNFILDLIASLRGKESREKVTKVSFFLLAKHMLPGGFFFSQKVSSVNGMLAEIKNKTSNDQCLLIA